MFDGGSFYSDSDSSLGKETAPGQHAVQALHVQDRGVFEFYSFNKDSVSRLTLTNLTVRRSCRPLIGYW